MCKSSKPPYTQHAAAMPSIPMVWMASCYAMTYYFLGVYNHTHINNYINI